MNVDLRPSSGPAVRVGDYVSALAWSADGSRLAVGSLDGTTAIVDDDGLVQHPPLHEFGVTQVAWSPTADLLATGGQDGRVRLWSAADGTVLGEVTARGWCGDIVWRPDGAEFAAAIGNEVIRVATDGSEHLRHGAHPSTVACLGYTPDGRHLGAGLYGGVWWYQGDTKPTKRFEWKGSLLALAIAPNGKWACSGNQDASVHCWRLWSGDELTMNGYPAKVEHLAWDDRSRLLAVGNLGEVTVWDFSGKGPKGSRPKQLDGHARRVADVGFQPLSTLLASAGADGRLCLWDPTASRRSLLASLQFDEEIACIAWSPAGDEIAVGLADGLVTLVEVDDGRR